MFRNAYNAWLLSDDDKDKWVEVPYKENKDGYIVPVLEKRNRNGDVPYVFLSAKVNNSPIN